MIPQYPLYKGFRLRLQLYPTRNNRSLNIHYTRDEMPDRVGHDGLGLPRFARIGGGGRAGNDKEGEDGNDGL